MSTERPTQVGRWLWASLVREPEDSALAARRLFERGKEVQDARRRELAGAPGWLKRARRD